VTAHCNVLTGDPVSSLIAGSKMATADVLAFTTRVEMHVATSAPVALLPAMGPSVLQVATR
jgi:hypothetical protein